MPTRTPVAVTVADACNLLQLSRPTIYKRIATGELRAVKIGRSTRIPFVDVLRLAGLEPGEVDLADFDDADSEDDS